MTAENTAQLNRHLYHDEMEALQRNWTPRLDGRREDITYEGRPLLLKGRPQVADDVYIRLIYDNVAYLDLFQGDHPFQEYRVIPERNRFILGVGALIRGIKEGLIYMGRGADIWER